MIANPVVYDGEIADKVAAFNALPAAEKVANQWLRTNGNGDLADVKTFIKNHYKLEQDYTCPYCKQRIEVEHNRAWDLEHIAAKDPHPQFMFSPQNLCISCLDCNGFKSNKEVFKRPPHAVLPVTSDEYLVVHPHFDDYPAHIRILQNPRSYIPRSEKGAYTVATCKLYRFAAEDTVYDEFDIDETDMIVEAASGLRNVTSERQRKTILTNVIAIAEGLKQN